MHAHPLLNLKNSELSGNMNYTGNMYQEIFFIYFGKKLDVRNLLSGRVRGNQNTAFKNGDSSVHLFHAAQFSQY